MIVKLQTSRRFVSSSTVIPHLGELRVEVSEGGQGLGLQHSVRHVAGAGARHGLQRHRDGRGQRGRGGHGEGHRAAAQTPVTWNVTLRYTA